MIIEVDCVCVHVQLPLNTAFNEDELVKVAIIDVCTEDASVAA